MFFKSKGQFPAQQPSIQFIHTQLDKLGLSVESIEQQNLALLEESLNRVNDFISYPESLRILRIKRGRYRGYYFSHAGLDISFDTVVRPILQNRKTLIMGRLETLKLDDGIQSLSESIQEFDDEQHQLRLTKNIQRLKTNSQSLRDHLAKASKEQEKLQIQLERERFKLFEGKFKIFLSLLEKEAAATLIGGLFIIIASLFLMIAMFTSKEAQTVMKDCLFLVFGYFFGQATTRSHAE